MTLNLQELEIFLAANDEGSFSAAGRKLNITQPAVSQSIQNLETFIGVTLFNRCGRGVHLTDAGARLLPMARQLIANARRLEEDMSALQGQITGYMQIGCSTSSGKYLIPGLIARFRQLHKMARIDVVIHSRQGVQKCLLAGQVNFGVSSKHIAHNDLHHTIFFEDEIVLIVRRDHPWANHPHVYVDDLLDVPFVMREETSACYEVVSHGLLEHDITVDMLDVAMTLGNAEAIEMAVEEGLGAAFVPRLVANRGVAAGYIQEVTVEDLVLTHETYLIRNRRQPFTQSQETFWTFVEDSRDLLKTAIERQGGPRWRDIQSADPICNAVESR